MSIGNLTRFLTPPPSFEAVYCFICGRRRVSVSPHRMINIVLNVTINDISVIYVTAHRCAAAQCRRTEEEVGPMVGLSCHRHSLGSLTCPSKPNFMYYRYWVMKTIYQTVYLEGLTFHTTIK